MGLIFFAFFEKFFVPILTSGGLAAVSSSAFAALYSAFGKYDVVHIHAEGPAFFAWLPKMFGKRVVVTVHGIDFLIVIMLHGHPFCYAADSEQQRTLILF